MSNQTVTLFPTYDLIYGDEEGTFVRWYNDELVPLKDLIIDEKPEYAYIVHHKTGGKVFEIGDNR